MSPYDLMADEFPCDRCGRWHDLADEIITADGEHICPKCWDEKERKNHG